MKHHIIYISGLGDNYDGIRRFLLRFWQIYGVHTQLVPMQWYDGKSYEEKYDRVVDAIEAAKKQGYQVSVIGESAGGSMAMNVFARNDSLYRLVSLSGVNTFHTTVSPRILARSPAFKESLSYLDASREHAVKKQPESIVSIAALVDSTVFVSKNKIKGVKNMRVFSVGHIPSILLCLSVFSFIVVREVKRPQL